jgi:hypothetical protein
VRSGTSDQSEISVIEQPRTNGFIQWIQDPLGSIIASSVAVIGSFGFVLSGTWFIHVALN